MRYTLPHTVGTETVAQDKLECTPDYGVSLFSSHNRIKQQEESSNLLKHLEVKQLTSKYTMSERKKAYNQPCPFAP